MWDVIINAILVAFGTAVVVALTIEYLDYQKAKDLALKESRKNAQKVIVKAIVDNIRIGNVSTVDIGLYDSQNTKQINLELETKNLSSDIYKGQILFN